MYVIHVSVEMRFIRKRSRTYLACRCLGLDQVAWAGEPDPFNGGCLEGQAEIMVVGDPSGG